VQGVRGHVVESHHSDTPQLTFPLRLRLSIWPHKLDAHRCASLMMRLLLLMLPSCWAGDWVVGCGSGSIRALRVSPSGRPHPRVCRHEVTARVRRQLAHAAHPHPMTND
jgi:hypothetical protein